MYAWSSGSGWSLTSSGSLTFPTLETAYDALGRVISEEDARGSVTHYLYSTNATEDTSTVDIA